MNRKLQIGYLFLVVLFYACSTDNNEPTEKKEFEEFIVDVNGQKYTFSDEPNYSQPYYNAINTTIYNNSKLVIKALDSVSQQSVTLTIGDAFSNKPLKEGRYQIGMPKGEYPLANIYYDNSDILGDNGNYYFNKNYGGNLTGNQIVGEIVINKIDKTNKRIKGTFKGELFGWVYEEPLNYIVSNVNLSNGQFDLPYTMKDDYKKSPDLDKGLFSLKIIHGDRNFTFLPTDGIVAGVGTRHFRIKVKINNTNKPSEIKIEVENENLGIFKLMTSNYVTGFNLEQKYNFKTDLSTNFSTNYNYIFFNDFYYNTGHISSPLVVTLEKNDSYFTIISLDKDSKIIEGTFGTNNSTRDFIISEGYFKVKYDEI